MSASRSGGYRRSRRLFGKGIFVADATQALRVSAEQIAANHYADKFVNQLYYGTNSQAGKFFGYSGMPWAGFKEGFATVVNFETATAPLYIMAANAPRVPVRLVKEEGAEETLDEGAEKAALRAGLASVPIPNEAEVLHGSLPSAGTDAILFIWCPATDEAWELRRLSRFASGVHAGEWKVGISGYMHPVSQATGVYPTGVGKFMGNSASGLIRQAGAITLADLVRVLRGGKIGHALAITAVVTKGPAGGAFLAPATRNDVREIKGTENGHNLAFQEDGTTANPAFGVVDAIPEGLRLAFPSASHASDFFSRATEPVAYEINNAIREHGLIVRDSGPVCVLNIEDARGLPIGAGRINPLAGAEGANAAKIEAYVNAPLRSAVGSELRDTSLPVLKEALVGAANVLSKQPWRLLEQLA